MLTYADDGGVGTGLVVGLEPNLPAVLISGELVDLAIMVRADPFQPNHFQNLHAFVAEGSTQLFGQEEVAQGLLKNYSGDDVDLHQH